MLPRSAARSVYIGILKFFVALHMSVYDWESARSIDFGVTSKFLEKILFSYLFEHERGSEHGGVGGG